MYNFFDSLRVYKHYPKCTIEIIVKIDIKNDVKYVKSRKVDYLGFGTVNGRHILTRIAINNGRKYLF